MSKSISKSTLPRAVAEGQVRFGDVEVQCAVLVDGTALISKTGVVSIVTGRPADQCGSIERFIDRLPGDNSMLLAVQVHCRSPNGKQVLHGISANCLVDILSAYADALVEGTLHHSQVTIGKRCAKILRAMAKTTATVMVYEGTGYRDVAQKTILEKKFEEYLLPDPSNWNLHFGPLFYEHFCRLYGYEYDARINHPNSSQFIDKYVYRHLDIDVAAEQKRRNPNPCFGSNHHQLWTDKADVGLLTHIKTLTAVMVASPDKDSFKRAFAAVFGRQLSFK